MCRPRSSWPRACLALAAVALMPLLHLWTIDRLDRSYKALSFDDPVKLNASAERSSQASTTSVASNLPLRTVQSANARPEEPAAHDAAAAAMPTTPLSSWQSLEMMSWAGNLLLGAFALAMICSIARGGSSDATALVGGTLGEPVRVLAGMAEQTRRDACETAHAMRTPISIIIGYAAILKRWTPSDDAKARRGIEAIDVSAVRLSSIVDEALTKALAVADLMQTRRELVVLRELTASIVGTSSTHFVMCDAAIETSVYGPRTAIEEVVRAVIEAFAAEGPAMIRFAAGDGTIELQVDRADTDLTGAAADDLGLNRWPRLDQAARTARLLGGSLGVLATEGQLQRAIVELPSARRSG
jgi:signal transduction histidine kinase